MARVPPLRPPPPTMTGIRATPGRGNSQVVFPAARPRSLRYGLVPGCHRARSVSMMADSSSYQPGRARRNGRPKPGVHPRAATSRPRCRRTHSSAAQHVEPWATFLAKIPWRAETSRVFTSVPRRRPASRAPRAIPRVTHGSGIRLPGPGQPGDLYQVIHQRDFPCKNPPRPRPGRAHRHQPGAPVPAGSSPQGNRGQLQDQATSGPAAVCRCWWPPSSRPGVCEGLGLSLPRRLSHRSHPLAADPVRAAARISRRSLARQQQGAHGTGIPRARFFPGGGTPPDRCRGSTATAGHAAAPGGER